MVGEVIDIDVVKRNLNYRIQEFRQLKKPDKPEFWYVEQLYQIAKDFREYGICLFLSSLDKNGMYGCLSNSADSRIALLDMADNAGAEFERYSFLSNNSSFFDALAAGLFDKACKIAQLSKSSFNEDYEYADDYTYTKFLFKIVLAGFQVDDSFKPVLKQLLDDMEGEELSRFTICEAIVENDEDKFIQALLEMIDEHATRYEKEAESIADHYRFRTQQYVFIEGLAMRLIGRKIGFSLNDEFRFCPLI